MDDTINGAQILAIKALSEPSDIAVMNLTELSDNEIKLLTVLSTIDKSLDVGILGEFVNRYCMFKRSKERKGERAIINAIRGASARFMQNVQVSRFKRLYSNVKEEEYE